jgi:hypothetical protein
MSRRDDRGYQIVYKSKNRSVEYTPPPRQSSRRDFDSSYDTRSTTWERGSATLYSEPRPRRSDRDYGPLRGYSETYERDGDLIVVETERRRSPARYVDEYELRRSPARYVEEYELRRRGRADGDEVGLARARTMPSYLADSPSGFGSGLERRARRYGSESEDEDRGRGREDWRYAERSPPRRLRSCMRGSRGESSDNTRARARSVSFREAEDSNHDVGNQMHERPGEEARQMGQYLRHDDDDDLASETYAMRRRARRYS